MNNTTSVPSNPSMPPDLHTTLGAAFFGFSVGAMYVFIFFLAVFLGANDGNYRLFGITVRQAYQYYTDNPRDSKIRKCIVCGHWKLQAPRGDVDASAHILFQFLDCARVVRSIRLTSFRPPLILCSLLDTLSLVFSMYMVYCLFLQILGDAPAGREVVWCVNLVSACNRRNLMLFVI